MKWFDANGTDVDAYTDRAFIGGVYKHTPTDKKYKFRDDNDGRVKTDKVNNEKTPPSDGNAG